VSSCSCSGGTVLRRLCSPSKNIPARSICGVLVVYLRRCLVENPSSLVATVRHYISIFNPWLRCYFPLDHHQLSIILDVLGTPSIDDFYAITSHRSKEYIRALPFRKKKNFTQLFPKANPLVRRFFVPASHLDFDFALCRQLTWWRSVWLLARSDGSKSAKRWNTHTYKYRFHGSCEMLTYVSTSTAISRSSRRTCSRTYWPIFFRFRQWRTPGKGRPERFASVLSIWHVFTYPSLQLKCSYTKKLHE
jgi:hypothetical protein